ncbi:MAG: hypothetical protein LBF75_06190 [Treponema sp.]|jgi:hypothetical protein|nr:hypothetical protein [Treponema sp.]
MAFQRIPETPVSAGIPQATKNQVRLVFRGVAVVPALVSAGICLGAIQSGFFIFFFLVPLGFMAYGYNFRSAWVSALMVVGGNGIGFLVLSGPAAYPWLNMLYFTVMVLVFTWIVAPPGTFSHFSKGGGILSWSTAYRLIIGSVIGALTCWYIIDATWDTEGFKTLLRSQTELFRSLAISAAGTDVVQRSLWEQQGYPETLIAQLGVVALRGGGLAACGAAFFINRQLSLVCVGLIRRIRVGTSMSHFHTAPGLIWVLSLSLLGVLVGTSMGIGPLELGAWNMVTICAILYLAQGGGIVLHVLSRMNLPPFIRVGLNMLLIILICSPQINLFALGALGILGIAEHWVSFRAPKSDGSSSTPGM